MNEPLSSEAQALLREARSFDEPSAADVERVRASVLVKVGVAAGVGAGVTAATPSIAASPVALLGATVMKVGAAIVVAGGLATAGYVTLRTPSAKTVNAMTTQARAAQSASEMHANAPETAVLPRAEEPNVPGPPLAERVAEPRAYEASPPSVKGRARSVAPTDRGVRAPRSAPDLEGEARLLEQADADLRRGDANSALARLGEHAAKYPDGALREEREGMRVVALCRAGREDEGRQAAQRFLARAPRSTLATRIRAACGD